MNPIQISNDPRWYRWLDGLVILSIGAIIGIVAAYTILLNEISTPEVIQRVPVNLRQETGGKTQDAGVVAPDVPAFRVEES